ncbi:alpha/beta fold hydrolase [Nonomuraea basaltis]|uniref:alpha/beta fold hydrolase n=1 Tax=Nonomuraea basaltis TaxID=2495887 RepID=UPI00110C68C8|nr:alpha/beta hydrolase [Nonomuraea basaltis]TMR97093.1 alpha/beta fold hydrolase [Nonomuraea basaltis]
MALRPQLRGFTGARIVALAVIGLMAAGLAYLGLPDGSRPAVPAGARPGDLTLRPCTYDTEEGSLAADCGTLAVPENRRDPGSNLIALPVVRLRATGGDPAEPIFRLGGGPGITNMSFPAASRLTDRHDVVLVGYRGVDGSAVLDCPEVTSALRRSADFAGEESLRRYAGAFAGCARRLAGEGIDLAGYSLPQRADDLEAARRALGYERINLISSSAGTRTAMIYAWRHPESIHRSAMIAVNPPGHLLWDPAITDDQLGHYARLCGKDDGCAARTGDLAAAMRATAADMPGRWGLLPIKEGNVRTATLSGLFHTTEAAAPLNAPTMIDAWLAAAGGDPSGFWALSVLADLVFPESFVWGEFAASGMIDAEAVDAYYRSGGDPGSILGNAAADFLWAGGRLTKAWPASPDHAAYRQVRPTEVETLLIGGTVDFSTPAQVATDELLPALPNGHQVILAELGHSDDFWAYRPDAGKRLLSAFFDRGEADDSLYDTREVEFEVGALTMSTVAKILAGTLAGLALIAIALLGGMARRVRRRGGFGPGASTWLRALAPLIAGLGGWCLAVLIVSSLWPAVFAGSLAVVVVSVGTAIGLGVYWAWVHRDWSPRTRYRGLAAALAGSFLGAWLGFHAGEGLAGALTAIVGAAITANLALLTLDIIRDKRTEEPAVIGSGRPE